MRCVHQLFRAALLVGLTLGVGLTSAARADYPTQIQFHEAIDLIVTEADLNSDGWTHSIDWIAASGNGSKVAFWTMASKVGESSQRHFWICNSDGSGLRDITPTWDTNENVRWPQLNHDGSRMFYVAFYHDQLRYINTETGAKVNAVPAASDLTFRTPYVINEAGTRAFFRDYDGNATGCDQCGVSYADIPGAPVRIMTLSDLPYDDYCNSNRFSFLGASDDGRVAIAWKTHDYCGDCTSMFLSDGAGAYREPNESVEYVYALQDLPHRIISRNGNRVLYHRGAVSKDRGEEWSLELLEPDTNGRRVLVDHGDVERPCLGPDGHYVRYNDPLGAYATLVYVPADLGADISVRDTISYHTTLVSAWSLTDICTGGYRWFGSSSQDWGAKQKLYRFELNHEQTGGSSGDCPVISRVSFSHNALLNDDEMKITAYVLVDDPQGLSDIEWVRMVSTIDYGRESAVWDQLGRAPLSAGGDAGSATLTDDGPSGTNGDEEAGDGVFTFDGFWTRSQSSFWEEYASVGFPIQIPIRVVVKDKDDNYTIVDAKLSVTDDPNDISGPEPDQQSDSQQDPDSNDNTSISNQGNNHNTGASTPGTTDSSADGNGSTNIGADANSDDTSGTRSEQGTLGCPTMMIMLLGFTVAGLVCPRRGQ